MHTPVKHIILSFIAFIRHDIYVQIKQNGTHQSTMFRNIQALLDMLQRSHNSHTGHSIFIVCDKEVNNLFKLVLLFKQFTYTNKTLFSMSRSSSIGKTTQLF